MGLSGRVRKGLTEVIITPEARVSPGAGDGSQASG